MCFAGAETFGWSWRKPALCSLTRCQRFRAVSPTFVRSRSLQVDSYTTPDFKVGSVASFNRCWMVHFHHRGDCTVRISSFDKIESVRLFGLCRQRTGCRRLLSCVCGRHCRVHQDHDRVRRCHCRARQDHRRACLCLTYLPLLDNWKRFGVQHHWRRAWWKNEGSRRFPAVSRPDLLFSQALSTHSAVPFIRISSPLRLKRASCRCLGTLRTNFRLDSA